MTDRHNIEWDVTYSGSYTRERIEDIASMDPDSGIAGPNLRSKIFDCREWVRNNPAGLTRAEFEALPKLMRNNTPRGNPGQMCTPVTEPARTITTTGHQSLLMPYYGQSIPHGVDQPIGTVTTRDRHALINAESIVDDCGFRMLEPYESAAAMAFTPDYIPRQLPKKHQMRLAGNAVCPPNMEWVAGRVIDWLTTL